MKGVFKQFCLNTYAHGFRYLALKNFSLFERCLWTLIMTNLIVLTCYYCFLSWNEAIEKQTITIADSPNYPISNFFFPAMTVCNFNMVSKKRALKFLSKKILFQNSAFHNLTDKLHLIKYLTDVPFSPDIYNDLIELTNIFEYNKIDDVKLLQKLSPTCKEMMERCTWKGQHVPCDMLFKSVATPYGFCCSFNYFGLKQDSMARLYTVSPQAPKRVSATGFLTGLEIIVNSILEDYFTRIIPSIGHKIILHFPYDFPDRNSQMLLQYIEELLLISVHPVLYRIDNNVKALEIDQRNCSFVGEKRLEYFTYTFHNCMSECRANLIRNICECVPFYYIHFYNYSTMKSIRICNLRDSICINQNIDRIYKSYSNCTCMQNCNYVRYSVETSSSIFTKQFVNHKPALYSGVKLNNQSVIRIYFDDLVSTRYTTSLRYYWHTILGRIGGVLGILIGLSATSLIEIMYFFIIRPIIDILFQYRIIYLYAKNGYK